MPTRHNPNTGEIENGHWEGDGEEREWINDRSTAAARAGQGTPTPAPVQAAPVQAAPVQPDPAQVAEASRKAAADLEAYKQKQAADAQAAQATGQADALAKTAAEDPQAVIQKQYEASLGIAEKEAKQSSDAAISQQIKAGRTSGMSQGASALQAMQGTGQQYQSARAGELDKSRGFYSDALGRQLQGRTAAGGLYQGGAGQQYSLYDSGQNRGAQERMNAAQMYQQQQRMDFDKSEGDKNRTQQTWNNIFGGLTSLGGALLSDRNAKTDIKQNSLSEALNKIKGYSYKYKGSSDSQAGIMAQDLEKGAMRPAVMNTPQGKMIDTNKLSTMNTGALAEHEKKIRSLKDEVQTLIKALGDIPAPKGKQ